MMIRTPGHIKFIKALKKLDEDGVIDKAILLSAASLRLLGIRVYTFFIDLLVQKSYYFNKVREINFSPTYELEPISVTLEGFTLRIGTVDHNMSSFRHLLQPYNIYNEIEFKLNGKVKKIKVRPHNYIRKDSEAAIDRLIKGSDQKYWQDLYSYHKHIEAIDLGMDISRLKLGEPKFLKMEA